MYLRVIFLLFTLSLIGAPIRVPQYLYKGTPPWGNHFGYGNFISHLNFRAVADIVIDQSTEWFDPDTVRRGDVIYLNAWYLSWFNAHVHDAIKHPYILYCGDVGSYFPLPEIKKLLYDPKLAAWFCRNLIFSYHPKLIQTAMGQDLSLFCPDPEVIFPLENLCQSKPFLKKHLLYMNHFPRKDGSRDEIVKLFENAPFCFSKNHSDVPYNHTDRSTYFEELSSSQFVLSPLGLETDCVRTWEALALDCIPIVEHTFLDPLFEDMPVLIVDHWEEINEPFLINHRERLKNLKSEKAYFPYWHNLIQETQKKVRQGDTFFSSLEATQFSSADLSDLRELLDGEDILIYKGFLSAIRPFQLADFVSKLYLYDPWFDLELFSNIEKYVVDRTFLNSKNTISVVHIPYILDRPQSRFNELLTQVHSQFAVFLDFTYYRNSLVTDFTSDFRIFDGRLERDLKALYEQLPVFTLLIGNQIHSSYVEKALSEAFDVAVERKGSFWYVRKVP